LLSSDVDLLQTFVTKANEWRSLGLTAGVEIFQMNAAFPDGSPVVLKWEGEAFDNGDGTFTGAWAIDT
jgi:hypothetical protein